MGKLLKRSKFKLSKELNDNSTDSLVILPQESGLKYELSYAIRKNVSGVVNTGRIIIDDNGTKLYDACEFPDGQLIEEINFTSQVNAGNIELLFELINVGENLVFETDVFLI